MFREQHMIMTEITDWYKQMPRFTKYWLSFTVAISVLAKLVFPPYLSYFYLNLNWHFVWSKFQIWWPITALFYYPTGFHFLINCFFLYDYSRRLEQDHFKSSPADYLFLLVFSWLCCVFMSLIVSFSLLMDPMVLSVYVWCQLNRDVTVNFWFGTRFKAIYLPWILLAFDFILSSALFSILGIIVGHLYYFLKFEYPQKLGGASYLETPRIFKQYFPDVRGGVHGFGIYVMAPENPTYERLTTGMGNRYIGAHGWGRGHVLGR